MESKHIMVVKKTALKNIVQDDPMILERIQDAVKRTQTVVVHTTHFMKLYLLHLHHTGVQFPTIDKDFIALCMRTVSNMPPEASRRGRQPSVASKVIMNTLKQFYDSHYEPLLGSNPDEMKASLLHIGDLLQYEETDILKNIKNNIFMHFVDRCKNFVNISFELKERLKAVDTQDLTEAEKKLAKRNISIEFRKVKEDLLSPLGTVYASPEVYHKWLDVHKPNLIKKDKFMKDSIQYDVKAKSIEYLPGMVYLCHQMEQFGKFFHAIPLRTSSIPSYITIDTTTLIMLMVDDNALSLRKNIKSSKEIVWDAFFKMENNVFNRKDFRFHSMIKTDGVGVSVLFHRKDQNPDKLDDDKIGSVQELYVDEVSVSKNKSIVGIDVGKNDILHCTDGHAFYRYTSNQRRIQTKSKKYSKLCDSFKHGETIEGMNVKEWETILSLYNKYTCSFEGFKAYLKEKMTIAYTLKEFYTKPIFRKLKFNGYINRQRSEDKMLNIMKQRFGDADKTVICIGDYDQGSFHLKGKEPTKGKGMRNVLRRGGYEVYLVDEFRTSCRCHNCHEKNEKYLYRVSHRPKTYGETQLVHGLLRCTSVNGCGCLWNRDVNGCLNIRMLAQQAFDKKERPIAFRRE